MKDIDKYVEEKAKEMCKIQDWDSVKDFKYTIKIGETEDFIRTIVEECKPKVSKEFVGKWNQTIAERVKVRMQKDFVREEISLVYPGTENLTQMLEEAGMGVEDENRTSP